MKTDIHVGILALQGNFEQHKEVLLTASTKIPQNVHAHFITNTMSLVHKYDALILPGGESSTMRILLHKLGLFEAIHRLICNGIPLLATCAGTILLAQHIYKESYSPFSVKKEDYDPMAVAFSTANITIQRNGYGRQVFSFCTTIETMMGFTIEGVFIRAPMITEVGKEVQILASYKESPVIVMQDSMLMSTFHPEAAGDDALHAFFLQQVVTRETHEKKDVLRQKA